MQILTQTNDAFRIAEEDLKLRGPGDLEGTQQSGLVSFHIADLARDQKILILARAEAEKILAIGKSNAESYRLSVEAMGGNNFTQLKVMESIATQKIKIMPDVLINGGGDSANGSISGLLGLQLLDQLGKKVTDDKGNSTKYK